MKMKFFLYCFLVGVVLSACSKADYTSVNEIIDYSDSIFFYDNVRFRDSILVPYLLTQKEKGLKPIGLPVEDTLLQHIQVLDTVPKDVFTVFAGFNAVNLWSIDLKSSFNRYPDKAACVSDFVQTFELLYCGETRISSSFDSYLFMMKQEKPYWPCLKYLFILNMKKDMIVSMALWSSYYKDGECSYFLNSAINKDNTFHFYQRILYEDDSMPESPTTIDMCDFSIDESGHFAVR